MKHILFGSDAQNLKLAVLIKDTGFNKAKLTTHYINRLKHVPADQCIAFNLIYETPKKCSAAYGKEYLTELLPAINDLGVQTLLVCDTVYFKLLTKNQKTDTCFGYVYPCTFPGFEHMQIILAPNFQAMIYNPTLRKKMNMALYALDQYMAGNYQEPGQDVIRYAEYPTTVKDVFDWLSKLRTYDQLTCDIEGESLAFYKCGISTISFAWSKHEGIAFAIDRSQHAKEIRNFLKAFFHTYQGTLRFHNAGFDMKVLVYELWMNHLADYEGMLKGIFTLTRSFDDTKLIAYLATNNAVKNELGLKALSAEYTGNYAQEDIADTSKIPLPELLEYNLKDCLATWYVYDKYYPMMVADQQQILYQELLKPSVKTLLQMELCGMPMDPHKVQAAKQQLTDIVNGHMDFFRNNKHIKEVHFQLLQAKAQKKTEQAKQKVYTIDDSVVRKDLEEFNPNSDNQVRFLLYDYFGLPVIDLTDSKQPSTSGKTLKKMSNHTQDPEIIEILEHLQGNADAGIILSTFIPAFEKAQQLPDGSYRLYGNFNLGGTQSLRLSSSNPGKF